MTGNLEGSCHRCTTSDVSPMVPINNHSSVYNCTGYQKYAMSQLNMSLVTTTSVLSMLGALLIIITFVAFRDVRTPLRKIIVFLSIADFVEAFGNLFGLMMPPVAPPDVDWPCRLQSFLTSSSALSSFLWSVIVAYYLYMALVKGNPEVVERQLLLVHVVCWGFPLTLNGVLLYMKKLGNSRDAMTAGWCWIHVKGMWCLLKGVSYTLFMYVKIYSYIYM